MTTASIVTYKTDRQELATVLRCLNDSCVERVFVVDNSPDDSLRDFGDFAPKVEYIWGQGNIGYGAAHNIAIRQAIENGARYHVVLNPDIYLITGTLDALEKYMEQKPDVGLVMPKVVYPHGEIQYLCKLLPSPMDLIGRRFIPFKRYVEKKNFRFEMRASGYEKEMEVPFLSGCFMFFRATALHDVQGFDDRFFMYCEDIDLCRRVSMRGYKTMYYPQVTIVHAHKKESFKSSAMLKAHVKSAIRYFNKWGWLWDLRRRKYNRRILQELK